MTQVIMAYDIHDGAELITGKFYISKCGQWEWSDYCKHCDRVSILDSAWTPVMWIELPKLP